MKQPNTSNFNKLNKELQGYKKAMGEASDMIVNENVSNFPIMVVHQQILEIGIPIAEKGKVAGNWSVNASSLEEFIAKSIIQEEKVDSFRTIYKNPQEQICLFVLSELGAQFVFIPRT